MCVSATHEWCRTPVRCRRMSELHGRPVIVTLKDWLVCVSHRGSVGPGNSQTDAGDALRWTKFVMLIQSTVSWARNEAIMDRPKCYTIIQSFKPFLTGKVCHMKKTMKQEESCPVRENRVRSFTCISGNSTADSVPGFCVLSTQH